ncbi:MAG: hypothetical protein Q9205_007715 [Flavoplaca limonia]
MAYPCSIGQKRGAANDLTPNDSPKRFCALKDLPTAAPLMLRDTGPASLPSFPSIEANNEDSGVTCSDDRQQQRSQPEYVSQPTSAGSFFSLPLELRNEIYGYLRPIRVHIAPPFYVQEDHHTKPWALIAVCRQFRDESRAVAYPETPIDIYLSELAETTAYETWIDGLHQGLEASIRHIGIDEFVDIDWIHDGPMPERPQERRKRLELEYLMDIERNYGGEDMCERHFDYDDYTGDWKVRWLQSKNGNHDSRKETVSDILDVMEEQITNLSIPMGGFGRDGIRKLVASYPASRVDPSACEEYNGEYGEWYGAEYAGDYGEGYGEEYEADSEEHGQEDLKEGRGREHEKEVD